MTRIFPKYAYGAGPRAGCWWDRTCDMPDRGKLAGTQLVDVAIIGAGFTGLSAALHLSQAGVKTVVLEAQYPGWGASGRNGGFCCLGGGMLEDSALDAKFGRDERLAFWAAEKAAVLLVADLVDEVGLDIDRHSDGETELAHRPKDMVALRVKARSIEENYGVAGQLTARSELAGYGMAGAFHGALTVPIGFGLNPLKYLSGLTSAAEAAGTSIYCHSTVREMYPSDEPDLMRGVGVI